MEKLHYSTSWSWVGLWALTGPLDLSKAVLLWTWGLVHHPVVNFYSFTQCTDRRSWRPFQTQGNSSSPQWPRVTGFVHTLSSWWYAVTFFYARCSAVCSLYLNWKILCPTCCVTCIPYQILILRTDLARWCVELDLRGTALYHQDVHRALVMVPFSPASPQTEIMVQSRSWCFANRPVQCHGCSLLLFFPVGGICTVSLVSTAAAIIWKLAKVTPHRLRQALVVVAGGGICHLLDLQILLLLLFQSARFWVICVGFVHINDESLAVFL